MFLYKFITNRFRFPEFKNIILLLF